MKLSKSGKNLEKNPFSSKICSNNWFSINRKSESKLLKYINGVVKSVFKGHPREEEGHVKNSKSTTNTQKRGSPKNGAKKAPRDRPGFNSILAQEITDTMSTMVKLDKEML